MRIIVLCDPSMTGPSVARCLTASGHTILTAGKSHLVAQAEASVLTLQYSDPDELIAVCAVVGADMLIPTRRSMLVDLTPSLLELPALIMGCPNGDPLDRETLWTAAKALGLSVVSKASGPPALFMSSPTSPPLHLSVGSDEGFKAVSVLGGDLIDIGDMLECRIDFMAQEGKMLAAACRDCLVVQGELVRSADVHDLSDKMLSEVSALVEKLEYEGPGTLSCFVEDDKIRWADLDVCLNDGMEMSAAAGLNIPAMTIDLTCGLEHVAKGLTPSLVTREIMTLYANDEED